MACVYVYNYFTSNGVIIVHNGVIIGVLILYRLKKRLSKMFVARYEIE